MSYSHKTDSSQAAITKAFRGVHWWHKDVSMHRGLGFDILTRHKDGFPIFLELKPDDVPSRCKLTESELAMREAFPHFFRVAKTVEQAFAAVGLLR